MSAAPLRTQRGQRRPGHVHVLRVMAAAHSYPTDDPIADLDGIAAAEDHETVYAARRPCGQRRIVLDEVVPLIGRKPEAPQPCTPCPGRPECSEAVPGPSATALSAHRIRRQSR